MDATNVTRPTGNQGTIRDIENEAFSELSTNMGYH